MDPVTRDAFAIKEALREAESRNDELMRVLSTLKQKMLTARANPKVLPHAGQSVLIRLSEVEQKTLSVSNGLARVHADLSGLATKLNVEHPQPTAVAGFNASDDVIFEAETVTETSKEELAA